MNLQSALGLSAFPLLGHLSQHKDASCQSLLFIDCADRADGNKSSVFHRSKKRGVCVYVCARVRLWLAG